MYVYSEECMYVFLHVYIHTLKFTYTTYIHSYIHTYIHTNIHTCIVTTNVRTKNTHVQNLRAMHGYICIYCMYVQYVFMYVCMYVLGISWSTRSVERRAADGVLPARQGDDEVDQHETLSQNIRKRQSEAQHFDCLPS